jgi:hypothetical protein
MEFLPRMELERSGVQVVALERSGVQVVALERSGVQVVALERSGGSPRPELQLELTLPRL